MTRKDIIDGLRYTVDMFLFNPTTGETYTEPRNDMDKITIDACRGAIELLEQKPKTGHWSRKTKVDTYDIAGVKTWGIKCQCDKCDFTTIVVEDFGYYKYCPNCGAKMVEPQEERDKE